MDGDDDFRARVAGAAKRVARWAEENPANINIRDAILAANGAVPALVVETAIRCLGASRARWDGTSKTMLCEPDGNTQMKAAIFLAAYRDGKPTNTTLAVNVATSLPAQSADDRRVEKAADAVLKDQLTVEDAMARSPALRQRMRAMLDAAEKAAGKNGDAVDV